MANWIPTHGIPQGRSYAELEERIKVLEDALREMVQAFVDYEMEVDIEPHHEHIKMMRKARAALEVKSE